MVIFMDKKLEVKNLQISFRTQGGIVKAVRNISFDVKRGETLAIVGESGSGKSVLTKTFAGMLELHFYEVANIVVARDVGIIVVCVELFVLSAATFCTKSA